MTRDLFLSHLKDRDYAAVSTWLDSGKNREWLNEKNGSGCTPLMWACDENQTDLALRMLDAGAKADMVASSGWTALAWASWHGNRILVDRLLTENVKVDSQTTDGLTAFLIAAQNGHPEILSVLKEAGAKVNHRAADRVTALHLASRYGRSDCVQDLLGMGLKIDERDRYGNTPLMLAYDAESAYKLMDHGADVAATNLELKTALHHAAWRLNHAVVDALLWRSANINAADDSNATPLTLALTLGHGNQDEEDQDPEGARDYSDPSFHEHFDPETFLGRFKLTIEALLDGKPDLEVPGLTSRTALMMSREPFATRLMLEAGANPSAKDDHQSTALMHAFLLRGAEEKSIEIARSLMKAGARVNDLDRWGTTCLCMAAQSNKLASVRMLVEEGAVDHWKDRDGNGLCMFLADRAIPQLEEIIETILPTVGDINRTNEKGKTLLMILAENASGMTGKNVARAIALSADPRTTTDSGWTALTIACVYDNKNDTGIDHDGVRFDPRPRNNVQIVEDLLAAGADPLVLDDRKNSLLHHAARTGSSELLQLLVELKIPPGLLNSEKQSALDIAVEGQNYQGAQALINAGVKPLHDNGKPITKLLDLLAANDDRSCLKAALETGAYDLDTRMRVIGKSAVGLHAKSMVELLDAADPEERLHMRKFALSKITGSGRSDLEKASIVHTLRAHNARSAAHALLEECGMGAPAP